MKGNSAAVFSTGNSRKLYDRSLGLLIEGGSSSSRGPANYGEYPIFMQRGRGSRLYDVDGNEYIDWMMGFGALPFGHADPDITAAIVEGASTGAHFATATAVEIEVAELLKSMIPNAEIVRFANTGTEAVMAVLRLARGFTGRPKILKFEGHYHGWYDDVLVSSNPAPLSAMGVRTDPVKIADSSGLNRHALDDTIVVPWNDIDCLERAVANYPGQIAAIITEGIMANMGVIPPREGYLKAVQEIAQAHGILFILDETVTGFRIARGGCQEYYGLEPDIVTFGKALGCGLPVAAFAGREHIMRKLASGGVLHYGTHNASRIGMHAAAANLRKLNANGGAVFQQIWSLADELVAGMRRLFQERGIAAIVQHVGPMFQILFTEEAAIWDYRQYCEHVNRSRYQRFSLKLFEHGIYTSPAATLHSIVTAAHTHDDVVQTLAAMGRALEEI